MHSDLHIRSLLEGERFSIDHVILIDSCNVLRCLIDLYLCALMLICLDGFALNVCLGSINFT